MRQPTFLARAFILYDHQEYFTPSGCCILQLSVNPFRILMTLYL